MQPSRLRLRMLKQRLQSCCRADYGRRQAAGNANDEMLARASRHFSTMAVSREQQRQEECASDPGMGEERHVGDAPDGEIESV